MTSLTTQKKTEYKVIKSDSREGILERDLNEQSKEGFLLKEIHFINQVECWVVLIR